MSRQRSPVINDVTEREAFFSLRGVGIMRKVSALSAVFFYHKLRLRRVRPGYIDEGVEIRSWKFIE